MQKLPKSFYDKFREIRARYGQTEYDADGAYLAEVAALVASYPEDVDEKNRARARSIIENANKADERRLRAQGELFPGDAHVALGGSMFIARDQMHADQARRRKALIQTVFAAHEGAFHQETADIDADLPDMEATGMTRGEVRALRKRPAA